MNKKIVSVLLAVLMFLTVIPVFSAAVSAEEGGITVSDWTASEITLYTTSDFVEFRRRISAEENNGFRGQTIKLGADIDLTGVKTGTNNTLPVGGCFYGIFDGQFHKLKNVPHKVTWGSSGILFGDIVEVRDKEKYPEPVTVRNLAIVELDSTLCYNGNYSGLLFCSVWDDLTIENVYISGSIDGLTGSSPQAVFAVEVKGNDDRESTLNISNCVFDGTVVNGQNCASAIFVGAVLKTKVGRQMNVKVNITNCLSTSDKPFIGSYEVEELKAKCTVTNTLQYTDSGVKADVGEGFAAQNYLDDNGMTEWTAREEGYPVPTSLLPFFKVDENAPKYVKFLSTEGEVLKSVEITGDGITIDSFPEVSTNITDVIWINQGTGEFVEAPATFLKNTTLVAKEVGRNESAVIGFQCGSVSGNKQNIRFIGGVYNLGGAGVGFSVTVRYKDADGTLVERRYEKSMDTVYDSINAAEDGKIKNVSANELGAKYLFALTLEDVPTDVGQLDFTVTSFKEVGSAKIRVDGDTVSFSVLDGAVNGTLAPLS